MSRKKILWLCSWYPNNMDPFNGDFIQRHARAAALYNDIYVIHVAGDESVQSSSMLTTTNFETEGLTEEIISYKKEKGIAGKVKSHIEWLRIMKNAIRHYIEESGKPHLIHVHIPWKAGIAGLWIKKKYGIPMVVTEHWGIYNDIEKLNYSTRSFIFKYYTKRIFQEAAAFLTVSKFLGEGVSRLVTPVKYRTVLNVVDTRFFYPLNRYNTAFTFIHVSNMAALKNAEGILRAFSVLLRADPSVKLIMAGDTNNSIREYANHLNIPAVSISFQGEIPYTSVAALMQESDCFILFSNIENSPAVIGEALCCGLPVIATNVGGIPELLHPSNSLLVPPGDEQALANAMLQVIRDRHLFNKKKIAESASAKFSYKIIGEQIDQVYKEVLNA